MSEPFLGEIILGGWNFAPRGYAGCDGQILPIAQNTALFSLLGTTYGGNGQTTFALPDLRGRVPMHQGQGPGLSNRSLGEVAGEESHTLLSTEMPQHNHLLQGASAPGTTRDTSGALLAKEASGQTAVYAPSGSPDVAMSPLSIANAGGSQPHNNMPPYLVLLYCIALEGIFPSRN